MAIPLKRRMMTRGVLAGEKGARRNVILLNTAAALVAAGQATDMSAGIRLAEEAIDSGAAAGKLDALAAFTRENG